MGDTRSSAILARTSRIVQRLGISMLAPGDELLDWDEVAGVAMDVSGADWPGRYIGPELGAEFAGYVKEVAPAVAEFTGLELETDLKAPVVFNRSEWIATTTENLKPIFEILLKSLFTSINVGVKQPSRITRAVTAGELGFILGYLSNRVLGQYDLAIMSEDKAPGLMYFVYPNIIEVEKKLGVRKRSFRLWLALHEVTHAFEFKANTWLKAYIRDLTKENARYIETRLSRVRDKVGENGATYDWIVKLMMKKSFRELISPNENPVLAKAQAIMSILEGYSEYVMAMAGDSIVDDSTDIAELLDQARKSRHWMQELIEKLIGLEVKIQQYKMGFDFIQKAVNVGGMRLANMVWEGPRNIPTLTELHQPELWIARMLKEDGY